MNKFRTIRINSFYAKTAFLVVVIAIGVSGGMYVGYAMIDYDSSSPVPPSEYVQPPPSPWSELSFEAGDYFPQEDYTELDGTSGNFKSLFEGRETVVVFASLGCKPCLKFFKQWKRIEGELRDGVQVVVCIRDDFEIIPKEYREFIESNTAVIINTKHFHERYNVTRFPTIVGVDAYGFVTHIQHGHRRYIDREFLERFTTIDLP